MGTYLAHEIHKLEVKIRNFVIKRKELMTLYLG